MITELRLVSSDGASTAAFWSAIFNTPAENLGDGRWRVTSLSGLSVRIEQTRVVEAITRIDLEVACDAGAPDRLRAAGFPVSSPGFPLSAEDLNGTDGLALLRVVGWDGISDVDWEEPIPERPVRDDAYYAGFSAAVEAGDYEAVGPLEPREEEPQ